MTYEQRITIKQAIFELQRREGLVFLFCQFYFVFVFQVLIYGCTDEEIGDDIVTFRLIITQLAYTTKILLDPCNLFLVSFVEEEVQVPLNDISCIGKLLIDRVLAYFITTLIVF